MEILLVDDKVPDPQFGAGFPRAYRLLLTLLSLKHTIHFIPTVKESIKTLDIGRLKTYGISVYDDVCKVKQADVCILSRPHNVHYYMPAIKNHLENIKLIYDTEALWFRRYDLQMSITGKLPWWAYRYDELGLARQVDLCFVVNDIEKNILQDAGAKKVVKLGHALYPNKEGLPFAERRDFLVVGGKLEEDSSNEDALWWFLENAWSQVSESTGSKLNVAGSPDAPRLKSHQFNDVNLMGHVPALVPLYESHRVFVAMTRFATGIPWKVHEAMANGIPCVISSLLADQLALKPDVDAMVARTPEECVEKCLRLYNDESLWNSVRENGYALIRRDCDPDAFKGIISSTLNELHPG